MLHKSNVSSNAASALKLDIMCATILGSWKSNYGKSIDKVNIGHNSTEVFGVD